MCHILNFLNFVPNELINCKIQRIHPKHIQLLRKSEDRVKQTERKRKVTNRLYTSVD